MQSYPFPAGRITFGTFNLNQNLIDANTVFQIYNTIWGLTQFTTFGNNAVSFASSVSANTMMSGYDTQINTVFQWTGLAF